MSVSYNIPAAQNQFEFEIKRSQFISYAAQARNRMEADLFIRKIRALHPQARHVCWAYIAGAPNCVFRFVRPPVPVSSGQAFRCDPASMI